MVNKIVFLSICIFLVSCNKNKRADIYQEHRNNIVNVKALLQEIKINEDDVLIGNYSTTHILGQYLLIENFKSPDKLVSIFDKNDFKYLTSTGNRGEGPNEILNPGIMGTDDIHGKFYITDHSKLKIFSFDIDSVLEDPLHYTPIVKVNIDESNFPSEYEYINDTLCVGRCITPIGTNNYTPSAAKWNMITGEIIPLSMNGPKIEKKRVVCASSSDYKLVAEMYTYHDLISIFDFNGNLRCNIYGPDWGENKIYCFSWGTFCHDKLIVSYSGTMERMLNKLIVFDINGNYIKTLDVGYPINYLCYDKGNNRLILALNDEMQFAYLNLKDLI